MAARLGLRAGEIAGLQLTDVNWLHGEMRIWGKAGCCRMEPARR